MLSPLCQVPSRRDENGWHISWLNEVEFWVLSRKQCRQLLLQLPLLLPPPSSHPSPLLQPCPHRSLADSIAGNLIAGWLSCQARPLNSNSNLLRCLNEDWDWNGDWVWFVAVGVDWTVDWDWEMQDDDAAAAATAAADNWWLLHLMQIFEKCDECWMGNGKRGGGKTAVEKPFSSPTSKGALQTRP